MDAHDRPLHHATGYRPLVGKYEFANHPRKREIVEALLPAPVLETLQYRTIHGNVQSPDLPMYAPDRSDWFFCEVMGPGDRLRAHRGDEIVLINPPR